VASVGPTGELSDFSNDGAVVDVAAPGGSGYTPAEDNILSTLNLGAQGQGAEGYAWYAGTSMSAPHVAGTIALMQSAAATPKTPDQIKKILENTAYASGGFAGGCSYNLWCGAGIIDARYPEPPPATELQNGVTVTGIEVLANDTVRYQLLVPNGASNLLFAMYGGTGDADMYVRRAAEPTTTAYDCRPFSAGNNENCFFPAPQGGTWYVTIRGFSKATGVSLYPNFVDANWPRSVEAEAIGLANHRTQVTLTWTHGKKNIDIYRNGAILKTVKNKGTATDTFRIIGSGTMSYKLCNNGTQECADPVEIDYASHR
jgi:serine protease